MKTYMIRTGTKVIENEIDITLKRGVIHKNELVINKEDSSNEFIVAFQELSQKSNISVSLEDSVYDDFETLTKFGFLTVVKGQNVQPLIVVEDELIEAIKAYLNVENKIVPASEFLSFKELELLTEDKDILKLSALSEQKKQMLANFGQIYLITKMSNLSLLRGFNKLMNQTKTINTIAFFDNENVFITCIEHGETGCYECLEQQLMTHFEGCAEDYMEQTEVSVSIAEILFALSIVRKEIDNVSVYGQSSLLGNIVHFNMNNYEFSFNTNRIQSCCTTCSTFNNILFEEQNIRSINVLKELMTSD
ncbi:SagC family bacteriocin biosynthesis cyclodehydratase [Enterococcus caccae]|uniref:SagC family bacteriocin biosynthesis cyclodehydratase n=1 Tax=Enterococcus caccae ATCC BAA-1240 TaxID=1158612 RepID=R3W7I1_9ENTE|nr:SagC family bacteriocin biosynthesis cyclodehydratase [Enterococcus caccae]EOL43457.1 SagC family bacteriocin biosynthesis cyclodehydratase [Enterococcus caccae ATCC BAA-1240]EOT68143.1 hypothetical protein I580_00526 [Enterococcus caccae ATCC BAA-1240]OJG26994.1 SagC family bacteriocin biosynthesis cyclodehydratase [Enterococcus caccae]